MFRVFVIFSLVQVSTSDHHNIHNSCNRDNYRGISLEEISSALGDDVSSKTSARIKMVDLVLKGFDCESRLARITCEEKVPNCEMLRNEVINVTESEKNLTYFPLRVFAAGLKLKTFSCHKNLLKNITDIKSHLRLQELCSRRDYQHFRSSFNSIFENTESLWKPEFLRDDVWNRKSSNSAFINERKCIEKWPFIHCLPHHHRSNKRLCEETPLILENMMIRMVALLLQGNQILSKGSRCPLDYTLDMFKLYGRHHSHTKCDDTLYMTTSDIDKLLNDAETRNRHCREHSHQKPHHDEFPQPGNSHWPEYERDWSHDRHGESHNDNHHSPRHHDKRSVWEEPEERTANKRSRNKFAWIPIQVGYRKHLPGDTLSNAEQVMKTFFHTARHNVSVRDFYDICPALLHHILFASSQFGRLKPRPPFSKPDQSVVTPPHANLTALKHTPTKAEVYGYGSLSVLLISLCSVVGAFFIKITKGEIRHYIMAGMLALGIGNLCGDAVLHLLPEIIAPEQTGEGDGDADDRITLLGNSDIPGNSVRMLAMLASMYGFYVLEIVMSLYHDHSHEHETEMTVEAAGTSNKSVSRIILMKYSTASSDSVSSDFDDGLQISASSSSHPNAVDIQTEPETSIKTAKNTSDLSVKVPSSVGWMIVVGDSVHNFADGLAIGAAFSLSITTGVSTSIAVICHELPHELGDFAVLVSTGMSIKKALWLNFLSSLTAFVGLYIGIVAGAQDAARQWIFSVGAGMFIYVALADLIPELFRYFKRFRNWAMFLVQNLGILAGYAVMLLIAIYEDEIHL